MCQSIKDSHKFQGSKQKNHESNLKHHCSVLIGITIKECVWNAVGLVWERDEHGQRVTFPLRTAPTGSYGNRPTCHPRKQTQQSFMMGSMLVLPLVVLLVWIFAFGCKINRNERNSLKNETLLKMYLLSGHPRCGWVYTPVHQLTSHKAKSCVFVSNKCIKIVWT